MKQQNYHQELPDIFTDSQMLKLEIKESGINGAGLGLFAKKSFQPGEYIAQYYGAIIDGKYSFSEPFLMQDKMVFLNDHYCVISRSPASRANDIVKWEPQQFFKQDNKIRRNLKQLQTIQGKRRNAQIKLIQKQKAFICATEFIKENEQIFIDYGFQYWEFFFKQHLKNKNKQKQ